MNNYCYRIATTKDIPDIITIKNITKERIINENLPMWLNGYPDDSLIVNDIKDLEGRVLTLNDEVIAYCNFHHAFKEYGKGVFKKDNIYCFGRLMVKEEYLNQGVATYLVSKVIEEAKSMNLDGIGLLVDSFNGKALKIYKKFNFEKEGEKQFPFAYLDIYALYF